MATATIPAAGLDDLTRPLLELALAQANAQGAYVYRMEGPNEARLIAWAGREPQFDNGHRLTVPHPNQQAPVVLHEDAWNDWRYRGLAEFRRYRFEGVVSVPLRDGKELVGVVHFCRERRLPLAPRDLLLLLNLGDPLSNLLTAAPARRRLQAEVLDLRQMLADRKLIERAKGLLQARHLWSEEQAYLYLRRQSRRTRVPIRNLAAEIVGVGNTLALVAPQQKT